MEIQQHDGVVDAAVISAELHRASTRGRGVARGEGGARDQGVAALPPPLYIGALWGAPAPRDPISRGGGGQGGKLAPQAKWGAPHP